MPITKSAKKALRQSIGRRKKNLQKKETYKKAVKEFRKLVAGKDLDKAKGIISKAFQALDKAAKAGTIKNNKASRLKSRLAKKLK